MELSIIIPAYNEANKIGKDVAAANDFLTEQRITGEIIIVDDGSEDGTAAAAGAVQTDKKIRVNILSLNRHRGKGFAVRSGVMQAEGKFILFADSGLCIPYQFAITGLDMIKRGECHIAHGSRKLPESTIRNPQTFSRRVSAGFFRWLMVHWIKITADLTDTQCGFKIYRGDIAGELYKKCESDGFLFDVEIILRALRSGYRIKEFPIQWTADRDSRLSLTKSPWGMMKELMRIKRKLK
ncbi:MAG TPA: glycosyltransferase [Bacteroidetes bacterium]|nr:glycosyltransferase [Bacteroidota bacterium]